VSRLSPFSFYFYGIAGKSAQYFFAMGREDMPFNRAQRSWVYRAAKNLDNTVAFGSTRDPRPAGTALFVNTPRPTWSCSRTVPDKMAMSGFHGTPGLFP
jgi:hypothetical protein